MLNYDLFEAKQLASKKRILKQNVKFMNANVRLIEENAFKMFVLFIVHTNIKSNNLRNNNNTLIYKNY